MQAEERKIQPITPAQMRQCLEALRPNFDTSEIIYQRENRVVIRWRNSGLGYPIILKMWSRPDLKGSLRRLLKIGSCEYEWRNLVRLSNANVAVPRPLGFCRVVPNIAGYTDVLVMEDLGKCERAIEYLKGLFRAGHESQVLCFENAIIDMTCQILALGMVDVDHGLVNIVAQPSGRAVRLDLELARRILWPELVPGMYGRMLGHLIALHAFAIQPDTDLTTRFAQRLRERLKPSTRVLRVAGQYSQKLMRDQFQRTGIDTHLILPWD